MCNRFIFSHSLVVRAFADRPVRETDQVEFKFLQTLLNAVIERGCLTQDDVQAAIESCGVLEQHDWHMYTSDEFAAYLSSTGNKLVGTFSPKQVAHLRKLRDLCCKAAKGNRAAWEQVVRSRPVISR